MFLIRKQKGAGFADSAHCKALSKCLLPQKSDLRLLFPHTTFQKAVHLADVHAPKTAPLIRNPQDAACKY